jgi:TPP-dependent pyruvate/acetoin dehydrogenase alpha subunit
MNPELEKRLFYQMLRIRTVEEAIATVYPEQEIRCPVHLCIGQEAVAAGACATLSSEDYVVGGHRSHGHFLAKGGSLRAMTAELYGRETGCCRGTGGSMYLVDLAAGFLGATPIVASTIPIGVGSAFASMLRGESRVSMIFFGEAATEEGVFHESVNFAVLHKLPVVFVCENNLYSVYSPMSVRQSEDREVFEVAAGHGLESRQADGNDVVTVYNEAETAVARARSGEGPTFLEFKTYRWLEHCGPNYDNDLGYRSPAEFQEWKKRCPVERHRRSLLERGVIGEIEATSLTEEIQREVDEAFAFAKSSPFPEARIPFEHIYAL